MSTSYIFLAFIIGFFACALWATGKKANEWAAGFEAGQKALEDMEDPADAYHRGYIDAKKEDLNPFLLTREELDRMKDAAKKGSGQFK